MTDEENRAATSGTAHYCKCRTVWIDTQVKDISFPDDPDCKYAFDRRAAAKVIEKLYSIWTKTSVADLLYTLGVNMRMFSP